MLNNILVIEGGDMRLAKLGITMAIASLGLTAAVASPRMLDSVTDISTDEDGFWTKPIKKIDRSSKKFKSKKIRSNRRKAKRKSLKRKS